MTAAPFIMNTREERAMPDAENRTAIEKFEQICHQALEYEHATPEYTAHYENLLAFMADRDEGEYRIMSAAVDYAATGEGRTLILFIARATTGRGFIERFLARSNDWHARGADVKTGMPRADHGAMVLLPADAPRIFEGANAVFFSEFSYNNS